MVSPSSPFTVCELWKYCSSSSHAKRKWPLGRVDHQKYHWWIQNLHHVTKHENLHYAIGYHQVGWNCIFLNKTDPLYVCFRKSDLHYDLLYVCYACLSFLYFWCKFVQCCLFWLQGRTTIAEMIYILRFNILFVSVTDSCH